MADINITITIPDTYVSRFSNVIDYIWAGRTTETKIEWVKKSIIKELKQKVLRIERQLQSIEEIELL
jgi:hypothetical protein